MCSVSGRVLIRERSASWLLVLMLRRVEDGEQYSLFGSYFLIPSSLFYSRQENLGYIYYELAAEKSVLGKLPQKLIEVSQTLEGSTWHPDSEPGSSSGFFLSIHPSEAVTSSQRGEIPSVQPLLSFLSEEVDVLGDDDAQKEEGHN